MWAKKLDEVACQGPRQLRYKGLRFPVYHGTLSSEQAHSGRFYYAYFGGKAMTESQIVFAVDLLIKRGLVAA